VRRQRIDLLMNFLEQGAKLSETMIVPPVSPSLPPVSASLLADRAESSANYGYGVLIPTILLLRTLIFAVGVIAVRTVHSLSQIDPKNASGFPWIAFDSHFYRYILLHGYPAGPLVPYQIAYFPLFPVVSRALLPVCNAIFGPQTASHAALLICSNVCSIIGLCFVYAWVRTLTTARTAYLTAVLMAVYPGSVFFSAGLTEAPFMMFVALALLLLQKRRFYAAAFVSAFATASRPTAVSLAITICIWTIRYSWDLPKPKLLGRILLIGMISVAGAASYQCYIWNRYQRFDAYKASEDKWDLDNDPLQLPANQRLLEGIDQVWTSGNLTVTQANLDAQTSEAAASRPEFKRYSKDFFIDRLTKTSLWNRVMALALIFVLIAACWQPTPIPRILMAIPLIIFMMSYLPNNGLRASSILRYETGGVPLFAVLAVWLSVPRRRPILIAVAAISYGVQLYYAFLFSRGFWIG
jgi:hypothetical protein